MNAKTQNVLEYLPRFIKYARFIEQKSEVAGSTTTGWIANDDFPIFSVQYGERLAHSKDNEGIIVKTHTDTMELQKLFKSYHQNIFIMVFDGVEELENGEEDSLGYA